MGDVDMIAGGIRLLLPRLLVFLIALMLLGGCSTKPVQEGPDVPAIYAVSDVVSPQAGPDQDYDDERFILDDVYDPWEGFNRAMYTFNARFDRYVFLPAVRGYEWVTPQPVQNGVTNFFSNIREITTFINEVLQLDVEGAATSGGRFLMNTTIGVLGFGDPATEFGIGKTKEDFGQTLGHYGVGPGPYLVLPIFGPSNLRDTSGLLVDSWAFTEIDPLHLEGHLGRQIPYYLLLGIDKRRNIPFRYYQTGSPFEYDWVRLLYTEVREFGVNK
jgi:phospholipid-binding lipoprotein MlaA